MTQLRERMLEERSGPQSLDSAAAILRWIPRFIMLPKAPA